MSDKLSDNPKDYIRPLNINGLQGRMMVVPERAKKPSGKEILYVYGVHASLERNWGLVQYLSNFGRVTMPDLPGFGGMTPFYKIGIKPTFESYADYLASFIRLRYRGKRITLMALSYSFSVVTVMLQKYPDLKDKIEVLVSVVGVNDKNNFAFSRSQKFVFEGVFLLCRSPLTSWFMRYVAFRRPLFAFFYRKSHPKMQGFDEAKRQELITFETHLWHANDVRTYGKVMHDLFNVKHAPQKVDMKLHHIGTDHDQWLNDEHVQAVLWELYKDVVVHRSPLKNHGSTVIADEQEAKEIIPKSIERILKSKR